MFICTECQKRYNKKPDYCDCGNDTFDEEYIAKPITKKKFAKSNKQSILERLQISIPAVIIFSCCILLSILILSIPIKEKSQKAINVKKTHTIQNIPDINTFWDDTKPSTIKTNIGNEKQINKPAVINQIQSVAKSNTNVTKKQTTQVNKQKTIKKTAPIKKQIKTSNTTNATVKKNTTVKSQITKAKADTQKTIKTNQNQNNTNNVKKQVVSNTNTQQQSLELKQQKEKQAKELYNYKISLRQALFQRLYVHMIQGSGHCIIEFSIDSNGKLINRKFSQKSDNKSVNDEVYKMLMKLPKFNPPPSGYNGEKLKMLFEFNNGQYLINFI